MRNDFFAFVIEQLLLLLLLLSVQQLYFLADFLDEFSRQIIRIAAFPLLARGILEKLMFAPIFLVGLYCYEVELSFITQVKVAEVIKLISGDVDAFKAFVV
jgi:hypothetical protein